MRLTEQAARALAVVRRDGRDLRYEVTEICHAKRYRLSVRYRAPTGDEVRLGLLYATDRAGLEALGAELSADPVRAERGRDAP
jgi:hypothetical protein